MHAGRSTCSCRSAAIPRTTRRRNWTSPGDGQGEAPCADRVFSTTRQRGFASGTCRKAHYLESWGDALAFDGTPFHHPAADHASCTRDALPTSFSKCLGIDETTRSAYDIVRASLASGRSLPRLAKRRGARWCTTGLPHRFPTHLAQGTVHTAERLTADRKRPLGTSRRQLRPATDAGNRLQARSDRVGWPLQPTMDGLQELPETDHEAHVGQRRASQSKAGGAAQAPE